MTIAKPPRKIQTLVKSSLGPLERQVLEIVCSAGQITVRSAVRLMGRDVAYTTVMTTMDRLYQKGVLRRRKSKRAYVYSSALSLTDFEKQTAHDLVAALLTCHFDTPQEFAITLISAIGEKNPNLVDAVAEIVTSQPQHAGQENPTADPSPVEELGNDRPAA